MTVVEPIVGSPYKGLSAVRRDRRSTPCSSSAASARPRSSWRTRSPSRLTVLYGPSGVGKSRCCGPASSPARCGAALGDRAPGRRVLQLLVGRPGRGDRGGGARRARRHVRRRPGRRARRPPRPPRRAGPRRSAASSVSSSTSSRSCSSTTARREAACSTLLPELVTRPGLRVNVVLGIRDDELARLDVFKARIPGLFSNYLRLDLLDREAGARGDPRAARALQRARDGRRVDRSSRRSSRRCSREVAAGRIDAGHRRPRLAVEQTRPDGRIETPYLQLVLQRLWEVERERRLGRAAAGDARGARRARSRSSRTTSSARWPPDRRRSRTSPRACSTIS